ncbi:hypothetical protein [Ramlibacter humi]|uniref:Uncharacterized protein n=1 Tax=Ramlibacter humi TaxID=2530451 RepID=A0A4Z0BS26_9BURK|nr:hypothetical protein [Ramlibacter humi]TFZ02097.1 hypothetical protein EZ216_13055 [Ramlibacter humi]
MTGEPLFSRLGLGIVGRGRLGYSLADILGLSAKPFNGTPAERLRSLWSWTLDAVRRPWCIATGCNFDTPVIRSWCLYTCTRCGCEMLGRTFADLEPAPVDDDDRFFDWDLPGDGR